MKNADFDPSTFVVELPGKPPVPLGAVRVQVATLGDPHAGQRPVHVDAPDAGDLDAALPFLMPIDGALF